MLSSLTLDDASGTPVVLHENAKRGVERVTGLVGVAPTRQVIRPRPQARGNINDSQFDDGKLVVVEGAVWSNISIEDAFAEFRKITTPMLQSRKTPALLKWREGISGNQLQRAVQLVSEVDPVIEEGAALIRYQAQFNSEDPRAYSQTAEVVSSTAPSAAGGGATFPIRFPVTFTASGGGVATIINTGNDSSPPLFRIQGAVSNPQVLNVDTGEVLSIAGEVGTDSYLDVNVAARTVLLNGATSRLSMLDSANSRWWELAPGVNNVRLLAPSFDANARLDVIWRAAFS